MLGRAASGFHDPAQKLGTSIALASGPIRVRGLRGPCGCHPPTHVFELSPSPQPPLHPGHPNWAMPHVPAPTWIAPTLEHGSSSAGAQSAGAASAQASRLSIIGSSCCTATMLAQRAAGEGWTQSAGNVQGAAGGSGGLRRRCRAMGRGAIEIDRRTV